jgi:Putative Ig domain
MLNIWTQLSNYSIGTFQENTDVHVQLPISVAGASYTVISGKLPPGLSLVSEYIAGTILEIPRETTFKFCIRAKIASQIADRTFTMTVNGASPTIILTPPGILAIGQHQQFYAMEETYVNFQISAIDSDTAAGQKLSYFVPSGHGVLPPGLSLSLDGLISGYVDPILSLSPASISANGYDSYQYDSVFYDMSFFEVTLNELNKTYAFDVTISDGNSVATSNFAIFVIGNKYLRIDNDIATVDSTMITSDSTCVVAPIWLTPSYFGVYRANNYATLLSATYSTRAVSYAIDSISNLPPGLDFDSRTGGIFGIIPFQLSAIKTYAFTITATVIDGSGEIASTAKQFTVDIIGELASVITWQTSSNLGIIYANVISELAVVATSSLTANTVQYTIIEKNGEGLPSGLQLELDGSLSGKATLASNADTSFTIRATDAVSIIDRTFTLQVNLSDTYLYSNIHVKPLMSISNRKYWNNFINDSQIFTPSSIYRMSDKDHGLQTELSMLIYAGIQRADATTYVSAMNQNHKRKRFQFGEVSIKTATNLVTNKPLYEVICVSMLDRLEPNGKHLPLSVTFNELSNPDKLSYYPSSISNWRTRISQATTLQTPLVTNNLCLPLWMRSVNPATLQELGFTSSIPLCFCKVGTAANILLNIKHSGFNFALLDYSVDRYIIDAVNGYEFDKYLEFNNEKNTIG